MLTSPSPHAGDLMACLTWCKTPESALDFLGPSLASCLLTSAARKQIGITAPILPERSGVALCLLVMNPQLTSYKELEPIFRVIARSFILPVQWSKGRGHATGLPPGFSDLADNLLKVLNLEGWRLQLPEEFGTCDLEWLRCSTESLWAPLAASLILAEKGGQPSRRVLATGRWAQNEMAAIRGVDEKIAAILQAFPPDGSAGKPILFVPKGNFEAAKLYAGDAVEIKSYPANQTVLAKALAEHLRELSIPPDRLTHRLKVRLAYANSDYIVPDEPRRVAYYLSNLVGDLAIRLRRKYLTGKPPVRRLVLVVSKHYELCILLLTMFRPEHIAILYTKPCGEDEGSEKYLDEIRSRGFRFDPIEVIPGSEDETIDACVAWLLREPEAEARAIEVTSGTKPMSLALAAAALRCNARIFYLDHLFRAGKPIFGTETLRHLDWFYWNRKTNPGSDKEIE